MFAPAKVPFRKSERSSIGSRWCSSSSTNATERDHCDREQPEDPRRRPAVAVGLDQRVDEREQADRRGDEARQVEPLLVRGVLRLAARRRSRRARASTPIGTFT